MRNALRARTPKCNQRGFANIGKVCRGFDRFGKALEGFARYMILFRMVPSDELARFHEGFRGLALRLAMTAHN